MSAARLPAARILVVDDEPDLRTLYELTLLREGHQVETAANLAEARACLANGSYHLMITDMRLPDGMGLSLIQELGKQRRPERAIVVTAYGSAESAVEALKQGAFDYLTKPVDLKQFRTVVATALQTPSTAAGIGALGTAVPTTPSTLQHTAWSERLVGASAAIGTLKEKLAKVATSMAPVMILGESGSGKEVVARAIHEASHRATGPFVAVNCGAIPETLIEAEFFGARKGAYTGATTDREGYFSAARGGTLFLDEIGDLPLAMQAKLLRVIQERRVRPLGGVQEEQVDVRILCATHKDLARAVTAGEFRQDLFYRLNVIEMRLPALRERRQDLPALVSALMSRICHESGQQPVALSAEALAWLQTHPFPGNVRELENLLHRALALCNGQVIEVGDLLDLEPGSPVTASPRDTEPESPHPDSAGLPPAPTPRDHGLPGEPPTDLQRHLDEVEKSILESALRETRGNRTAAAARLGLNLRQIRYRIARLGIQVGEAEDNPTDGAEAATPTAPGQP
ncbi:MAG TPA: sigma-54 dependent transcriptional regulator [Burkholderiaceae bacterium]|nr:sigma-54 dependent transcriptional regulator [Burkholderiaceae bacterium]